MSKEEEAVMEDSVLFLQEMTNNHKVTVLQELFEKVAKDMPSEERSLERYFLLNQNQIVIQHTEQNSHPEWELNESWKLHRGYCL